MDATTKPDRHAGDTPAAGRSFWLIASALGVAYIAVRVIAWRHTVLVEDTDSIALLNQVNAWIAGWRAFHVGRMITPDNTPFYPGLSALLSLPGGSVEFAARLCSLLLSLALFFAVLGLGLRIAEPPAVLAGLAFMTFSPILIPFSFSVLTEPSYLGLVYIGLYVFVRQYAAPSVASGALLGLIFGLSFLDRTEGILYLAFIPFVQVVHYWFTRDRSYSSRQLIRWGATFTAVFVLLAAPQVWRVSRMMGGFAINGRQAWALYLGRDLTGEARDRKLWGLDYSPGEMNIQYIETHPEIRSKLVSTRSMRDYLAAAARNLTVLYHYALPTMAGAFGIALFALGIVAIYLRGQRFETFLIIAFIANAIAAPIVQNLLLRHVLVLLPLLLLVAGIGAADLVERVVGEPALQGRWATVGLALVTGAWVAAETLPLRDAVFYPPTFNREYSRAELEEPIQIVHRIEREELHRAPIVGARRPYLPWYAHALLVVLPFADVKGLRTYLEIHRADLLFLEYSQLANFPMLNDFAGPTAPEGFELLYRKNTATNGRLELYRVLPSATPAAAR
jgi:4-amino-4-deoxy-L-arabinose transferase-like glycosyltransferase